MDDFIPHLVPPLQCHACGCAKFHKDEKRLHLYQDYVDNHTIIVQVERRRYRCSNCGTKQWDNVCGASKHLRKTYRLLLWEGYMNRSKKRNGHKQLLK